jgi:hypothetical protein
MLLSMFTSFLLARRLRGKVSVTLVAVIVELVSIFSTCDLFDLRQEYLFLYPPAPPLSFPFHTRLGLIPANHIRPPLPPDYVRPPHTMLGYRFYFLSFKLGELKLEYHTTEDVHRLLSLVFSSFVLINLVGAILGYEMSKIRRIREWGTSTHWNLLGFVLGMALLGCATIVDLSYHEVGPSYGVVYSDALAMFGILVLAIVIGRILWSKISRIQRSSMMK